MNLGMLAAGPDSLNFYRKGMELMTAELASATASGDAEQAERLREKLCAAHCSICELHMTDLCDEDNAEATCEQSLQAAHVFAPHSPDLWVQWANLRLCQVNKDEATKFTYKAVSLTKKLEEAERPSLEVCRGPGSHFSTLHATLYTLVATSCTFPYPVLKTLNHKP